MTLIILLLALGLDFFVDGIERVRSYSWWLNYYSHADKKFGENKLWHGPFGVILLLILPLILVVTIQIYLDYYSWFLEALYTLAVLLYCLSPEKLDSDLDYYIQAIEDENDIERERLESEILGTEFDANTVSETDVIKSSLLVAQERSFAVIFWFLVLGILGVVLYRLVCVLDKTVGRTDSGFSRSLLDLRQILEWPTSRITVLGMALAGHLMQALNAWRQHEKISLKVNDDVLLAGGLGALQYDTQSNVPDKTYWVGELKGQINRTLIIWLAVIAIMTLAGKLG